MTILTIHDYLPTGQWPKELRYKFSGLEPFCTLRNKLESANMHFHLDPKRRKSLQESGSLHFCKWEQALVSGSRDV